MQKNFVSILLLKNEVLHTFLPPKTCLCNLMYKLYVFCYKKQKENREIGEDATEYGEFISSYFAWVPLPKQKERAEELEKSTKNGENNRK